MVVVRAGLLHVLVRARLARMRVEKTRLVVNHYLLDDKGSIYGVVCSCFASR